jgi:L-arabinose isomerase
MGYLTSQGKYDAATLKTALAYGTIVASYNVEDFSLERMKRIERADVDRRLAEYRKMLSF